METYNLGMLTKKLYAASIVLFTTTMLRDILEVRKESTFFHAVERLVKHNILTKIEKNKYLLRDVRLHDFSIANFLYQPSYVSFESALNFHGILSQFPYEITSATTKKTVRKEYAGTSFSYTHLQKGLSWGYEKIDGFLIATPVKALLDQVYVASRGLKTIHLDEYDISKINADLWNDAVTKCPASPQFLTLKEKVERYIHASYVEH